MKQSFLFLVLMLSCLFSVKAQNVTDKQGLRQGKWTGTYSNGALRYRGQFRNGKPYGTFIYYYPAGMKKAEMVYSDNGRKAHVTTYYLDGKKMAEGYYFDKKKDSTWRYYNDPDGKLVLEENYCKGVKEGTTTVFFPETGKPAEVTEYKNGKKNGRWIKYFSDGKISTIGTYVNDTLQGPFKVYDITGRLLIKGQYKHALQDGTWYTYDTLGQLQKKVMYHNGLQVKAKENKK